MKRNITMFSSDSSRRINVANHFAQFVASRRRLAFTILLGSSVLALAPATAKAVSTFAYDIRYCSQSASCMGASNVGSGSGVSGSSAKAAGVIGQSQAPYSSSLTAGVFGSNSAIAGVGVSGQGTYGGFFSTTGSGNGYTGVAGLASVPSSASSGYAFDAYDGSSGGGYGIVAGSVSGIAATFASGANNSSDTMDLIGGTNYLDPNNFNFLINAQTNDGVQVFTLDSYGNIILDGTIYTNGSCYNGCAKKKVRSYISHESEPTMEDVGQAKLRAGSANVALDPAFRNVINSDAQYAVLITPEGDSNGLYVAQRTSRGFVVRENRAGHSSLPFSYRIVAKPFGEKGARLPMIANAVTKRPRLLALPHLPVSR
jgi:hypothetical protein